MLMYAVELYSWHRVVLLGNTVLTVRVTKLFCSLLTFLIVNDSDGLKPKLDSFLHSSFAARLSPQSSDLISGVPVAS